MVAASSKGSTPKRMVPPFGHELFEVAVLPVPPHETASRVHAISAKTVGRRRAMGMGGPPLVTSRDGAQACQAVVSHLSWWAPKGEPTVKGWPIAGVPAVKVRWSQAVGSP